MRRNLFQLLADRPPWATELEQRVAELEKKIKEQQAEIVQLRRVQFARRIRRQRPENVR